MIYHLNNWIVKKINKTLNRSFYNDIRWAWLCGNDHIIVNIMQSKYTNPIMWEDLNQEIWLIYLNSLINLNKIDQYDLILKMYINKFDCFNSFEKYLPLSHYLYNSSRKEFEKSSLCFDYANNNQKKLEEVIRSAKSIAIVGNGSSHLHKGRGCEIDEHDVVVRFNNFKINGFEADYGSKTDIWVRGLAADILEPFNINKIPFVVWSNDFRHIEMNLDSIELMNQYRNKHKLFTYLEASFHKSLRLESGIIFPTSGLLFFWYTKSVIESLEKISVYGFGFQSENPSAYNEHYFEKRTIGGALNIGQDHDMNGEFNFLSKIYNKKENY